MVDDSFQMQEHCCLLRCWIHTFQLHFIYSNLHSPKQHFVSALASSFIHTVSFQGFLVVNTCRSFWGFQSESKMMQVSAAVRLMPRPPARVQSRKTKRSESGLQKRSMAAWRKFPRTRPSMRSYVYLNKEGDMGCFGNNRKDHHHHRSWIFSF